MEALLLSTSSAHPLLGGGRLSSLHSFSKASGGVLSSSNAEERRSSRARPMSIVAKRRTGESSAKVVADGAAAVSAVDVPDVKWGDVQWDSGSIGHRQPKPPPEEIDKELQMNYLTKILGSKVYDVAIETPLELAPLLSNQLGCNIWLKREDTQQVFSFKIRGAYNMIAQLTEEQRKSGIICASAGNHAQGVALSAKRLKCIADVVMPLSTPQIKIDAVERLGGIVDKYGTSFDEAQAHAKQRSIDEDKVFIPPFDDEDVIAGQGTVGMEIDRQMRGNIHAIFVPVGGGGLVSGIASYYKLVHPEVKIFGVEPNDQNSMAQALYRGQIVNVTDISHFADGVAVQQVGNETFRICNELLDDMVTVTPNMISSGIRDCFNDKRSIMEPSGALAVAAAKAYCQYYNIKNVNIVAVTSGANMNFDQLGTLPTRANLGSKLECVLATMLPEKPGSLKAFVDLLLDVNITELSYRYTSKKEAVLLYKIGAVAGSKIDEVAKRLESSQFKTYNLSDNHAARDHFRYLMGGRADLDHEVICRFTFPEKPGALKHLLNSFCPRWNVSLFRHQHLGILRSDGLVGLQVKPSEMDEFHHHARRVGYKYEVLPEDDASRILSKL